MRRKNCLTIFVVSLALLGLVSTPVMAVDVAVDKVSVTGYAEFGIAVEQTDIAGVEDSQSDMAVTNVELAFDAQVNELVKAHALLYYERPFFGAAAGPVWDEAIVTIGDAEKFVAVGLMYAPFGAQQTHFPGDPAIAAPLTLVFGEAQAEAVAVGMVKDGLTAVVYGFKGKWDGDSTNSYGLDVNYKMSTDAIKELTVGASYLSNVCESDTLHEALATGFTVLSDDYAGAALYLHVGIADFFIEAEYMTALDEIVEAGVEPSVMNIEAGYNLEAAGKNLELVVKYAASDEIDLLPETRYGIAANLELLEDTTVSLAYITDEAYNDDTANMIVAVIGVEF